MNDKRAKQMLEHAKRYLSKTKIAVQGIWTINRI